MAPSSGALWWATSLWRSWAISRARHGDSGTSKNQSRPGEAFVDMEPKPSSLDCWVGSLDLNLLGNQEGFPLNPKKLNFLQGVNSNQDLCRSLFLGMSPSPFGFHVNLQLRASPWVCEGKTQALGSPETNRSTFDEAPVLGVGVPHLESKPNLQRSSKRKLVQSTYPMRRKGEGQVSHNKPGQFECSGTDPSPLCFFHVVLVLACGMLRVRTVCDTERTSFKVLK